MNAMIDVVVSDNRTNEKLSIIREKTKASTIYRVEQEQQSRRREKAVYCTTRCMKRL